MVWVYVGMSNRLPLPCCVYSVMRSAFPIAEDQYHGYEEEDEDELYCSKRKNTSLFSMNGWRYSFQPSKRMIKVVLRENCEVPRNIVIQRLDFTIFMSSLFSWCCRVWKKCTESLYVYSHVLNSKNNFVTWKLLFVFWSSAQMQQ